MLLLFFVFIVFLLAYNYFTRNHDFWEKKKVLHDRPLPFFGNHIKTVLCLQSTTEKYTEIYNKFPDSRVIGYYTGNTPELIIKDVEILKKVLITDFNTHFFNRGQGGNPNVDFLQLNIFSIEGDVWKLLRQRMTPAFSSGKLKNMFPLIVKCAENFQSVVDKEYAAKEKECEMRNLMARLTTDFIGCSGFGVEMDTVNDEHSLFRELGKSVYEVPVKLFFFFFLRDVLPEITKNRDLTNARAKTLMIQLFNKILKDRNNKPIGRHDFVDLMIEMANKGKIVGESLEKSYPDGTPATVELELTIHHQLAQMWALFIAGFETSASSASHALYQFALHPDVQERIQKEIDKVLSRYDNKLCYDAIVEMDLLNRSFQESMRLLPVIGYLNREVTRPYTIKELDLHLEKGTKIVIPVQSLHMDPNYFENPKVFDPDRFLPENVQKRPKCTYLPFGEGGRSCIGARLGHIQAVTGLAALLQKFTVEPTENTPMKLKLIPYYSMLQRVKGGFPLRIKRRNYATTSS